jgi:transketolase
VDIKKIEADGAKIKLDLFKKYAKVREGHPGSVLSIFDIVNVLYEGEYLSITSGSNLNDSFIMSKGHAASVQYPFLVKKNIIPKLDWDNWGEAETCLRIFGNTEIPGIDITSGSLGHGVGIGCGMAISDKLDSLERNIVVIISEGELYEGSTWESLLFLAHHKLTNVKLILDVNRNMILGRPEDCLNLEDFNEKFEAFGLETKRIDGHNYGQIVESLDFLFEKSKAPRVVIADTIKGKGVSFMEGKAQSHYWAGITEEQIVQMIEELS